MKSRVKFNIEFNTDFGDTICVVGNIPELGNWNPHNGVRLSTSPGKYPSWESDYVDMILQGKLEYKYVTLKGDGSVVWEVLQTGNNRLIYSNQLKGFEAIIISDDCKSFNDKPRKIQAIVESIPKGLREEDPMIKLIGANEQFIRLDLRNMIWDSFSAIKMASNDNLQCPLWIQTKGNAIVTGGSLANAVYDSAYKFGCDVVEYAEGDTKVKDITVIYNNLAPMLRPRFKHVGLFVANRFVYVIGGNSDNTAEKYDIEKDKWTFIPSNRKDFSNGALTLLDERYLLAMKKAPVTQNISPEIYAEKLDLLDEESGWESLQLNLEPCIYEKQVLGIKQAGTGRLSILALSMTSVSVLYLFDMVKNKILRKEKFKSRRIAPYFGEYKERYMEGYFFIGNTVSFLRHAPTEKKKLAYKPEDASKKTIETQSTIWVRAASTLHNQ